MAIGGTFLVLMFWPGGWWPLGPSLAQDTDREPKILAPPHLVALLPEAAEATVAAGYTGRSSTDSSVAQTTEYAVLLSIAVTSPESTSGGQGGAASTAGHQTALILGDTRYAWQEWSSWHCNCEQGSMSRVRDITYLVPGVRLDPAQYDVLRFQRVVCSYTACECSREQHQCDQLEVTCHKGPVHMCALRDIEQDQERKQKHFWVRVHQGLKTLWQTIKDTFPTEQKAVKAKSKQ